jgi:hypothetical protein
MMASTRGELSDSISVVRSSLDETGVYESSTSKEVLDTAERYIPA